MDKFNHKQCFWAFPASCRRPLTKEFQHKGVHHLNLAVIAPEQSEYVYVIALVEYDFTGDPQQIAKRSFVLFAPPAAGDYTTKVAFIDEDGRTRYEQRQIARFYICLNRNYFPDEGAYDGSREQWLNNVVTERQFWMAHEYLYAVQYIENDDRFITEKGEADFEAIEAAVRRPYEADVHALICPFTDVDSSLGLAVEIHGPFNKWKEDESSPGWVYLRRQWLLKHSVGSDIIVQQVRAFCGLELATKCPRSLARAFRVCSGQHSDCVGSQRPSLRTHACVKCVHLADLRKSFAKDFLPTSGIDDDYVAYACQRYAQ